MKPGNHPMIMINNKDKEEYEVIGEYDEMIKEYGESCYVKMIDDERIMMPSVYLPRIFSGDKLIYVHDIYDKPVIINVDNILCIK